MVSVLKTRPTRPGWPVTSVPGKIVSGEDKAATRYILKLTYPLPSPLSASVSPATWKESQPGHIPLTNH